MKEKIIISGIGLVSSIGAESDKFYNKLLIDNCAEQEMNSSFFKVKEDPKILKNNNINISKLAKWIIYCIQKALEDAKLTISDLSKYKTQILVGTFLGKIGGLTVLSDDTLENFDNVINEVTAFLEIDIQSTIISSACASSSIAIGIGYQSICSGMADIIIAGGYEEVGDFVYSGMKSLRTLSDKIQPFDKNRNGTVLGEGAGIIILERENFAKQRNAKIYAEFLGYGISNDSLHPVRPDIEGYTLASAIKASLKDNYNIDYINAHGTGTYYNDVAETNAIKLVFANDAYDIPISSIKPFVGHTLGAAGVLECIATILTLKNNIIAPNLNHTVKDKECDLYYIQGNPLHKKVFRALSNSLGFGGVNCALAIGKYDEKKSSTVKIASKINSDIVISHSIIAQNESTFSSNDLLERMFDCFRYLIEKVSLTSSEIEKCGIIIDMKGGINYSQKLLFDQLKYKGVQHVSPKLFIQSFPGFFAGEICTKFHIKGPSITICDSKNNIDSLTYLSRTLLTANSNDRYFAGKIFDDKLVFFFIELLDDAERRGFKDYILFDKFIGNIDGVKFHEVIIQ